MAFWRTDAEWPLFAALFGLVLALPMSVGAVRAQEIMLERIGAVRMTHPGDIGNQEDWRAKAFRNQARLDGYDQKPVASSRADQGASQPH